MADANIPPAARTVPSEANRRSLTPDANTRPSRKHFEERVDPKTGERYIAVFARGQALTNEPLLNKGTCFTLEERDLFGLRGVLPAAVSSGRDQEARAYENYRRAADDVARYEFLAGLQDRNETLFYRLLLDHIQEMAPIVYTPTVGLVCERYSHMYRRPRGVYISVQDRGHMVEALENAERDDTRVIVVTDNEAILGIGDQGVGGMGISIGKLALYTAGAGIHPIGTLPLDFDIGTDNPALLADPLYLGVRQPRLRGDAYFALLDELVDAIAKVFPRAVVQWEDFANQVAFQVLRRYRAKLPSFDDDIQGTGAVVEAGIRIALDRAGRRLEDERIVFFGAGASGAGCALQLRNTMHAAGVPNAELPRRVLCLDSQGLILADRPGLEGQKKEVAADPAVVGGWPRTASGRFSLLDVARNFKPTILVGASGQPGTFTEEIIREVRRHCGRPIVMALSNPTDKIEARPENILRWTDGAAIVGTGSPFAPVLLNGISYQIGQCNNVFVFPGIGLGAIVVNARSLPDEAFSAAAKAVHDFVGKTTDPGAPILPSMSRLRDVSRVVAVAVARALVDAGAAPPMTPADIERRVAASMWEPAYRPYRAAVRE